MIDLNLFNAKNIDRKTRVVAPPKKSPTLKKYGVSDNLVNKVKSVLVKGKELSVPLIGMHAKVDRSSAFKVLRVLEDNELIARTVRVGESGRPETFVTLL